MTTTIMTANTFVNKVGETKEDLPFFFRAQLRVDRFRLKQYKKIADKIPELEYKVNNPQGWLADRIVEEATVSLDKLLQKTAKGKKLSSRWAKKLIQLQLALTLISMKQIGRKHEEAKELLMNIVPKLLGDKEEK